LFRTYCGVPNVHQYAQEVTSNGFHGYDWGSKADNFQHHHGDVPVYLLEDVITPVALYWGDNDWLAAPEDILNTIMHLPNVVKGMNHEVRRIIIYLRFGAAT
jgi:hypothetical protein